MPNLLLPCIPLPRVHNLVPSLLLFSGAYLPGLMLSSKCWVSSTEYFRAITIKYQKVERETMKVESWIWQVHPDTGLYETRFAGCRANKNGLHNWAYRKEDCALPLLSLAPYKRPAWIRGPRDSDSHSQLPVFHPSTSLVLLWLHHHHFHLFDFTLPPPIILLFHHYLWMSTSYWSFFYSII